MKTADCDKNMDFGENWQFLVKIQILVKTADLKKKHILAKAMDFQDHLSL